MNKSRNNGALPVLELNDATVQRGGKPILKNLSLTIQIGQNTAIIGPNGSGKSTLIKLLTHKIYPLAHRNGTVPVRMFGKDHWNVEALRSRLGIVSSDLQSRFLNYAKGKDLCGLEVVVSGFFASVQLFVHQNATKTMYERAREALAQLDAGHLVDKSIAVMSTGEARRVLIARALVHQPEVLVLDEPTTALDFVARHHFMGQVRTIVQQGTTLVLVTHHIEEVIPEINRIILLQEGQVAFDGSKRDGLTADNLGQAFGEPVTITQNKGVYKGSLA